jgi:hypothetical protein
MMRLQRMGLDGIEHDVLRPCPLLLEVVLDTSPTS